MAGDKKVYQIASEQLEAAVGKLREIGEKIVDPPSVFAIELVPQMDGSYLAPLSLLEIYTRANQDKPVVLKAQSSETNLFYFTHGNCYSGAQIGIAISVDDENHFVFLKCEGRDSKRWEYSSSAYFTKTEIDAKLPLVVTCDIAPSGTTTNTSIDFTVSNLSATFAEMSTAYNQGRDIIIVASYADGFVLQFRIPLLGGVKLNDNVGSLGFKAAISQAIIESIAPAWAPYDCFFEMGISSSSSGAKLMCNDAAIAAQIGDIETALSQV